MYRFFGGFPFRKGKGMLLLNHHIFVRSKKNEVLQIYCSFSIFICLKDKKLRKLAVALTFLTVLSLSLHVFC